MTPEQKILLVNEYSSKILEIIDNVDDFTRSDLQGAIMAIVMQIINQK